MPNSRRRGWRWIPCKWCLKVFRQAHKVALVVVDRWTVSFTYSFVHTYCLSTGRPDEINQLAGTSRSRSRDPCRILHGAHGLFIVSIHVYSLPARIYWRPSRRRKDSAQIQCIRTRWVGPPRTELEKWKAVLIKNLRSLISWGAGNLSFLASVLRKIDRLVRSDSFLPSNRRCTMRFELPLKHMDS